MKELQRENESLSAKLGNSQLSDIMATAQQIGEVTVIAARVDVKDNNGLRQMMDEMKQKLSNGVIVLGAAADGKVMLVSGVTEDLKTGNFMRGKSSIMSRRNAVEKAEGVRTWQWLVQKMLLNLMKHFNPCMIMSNLFNRMVESGIMRNGHVSDSIKTDDLKAGCRSWIHTTRR